MKRGRRLVLLLVAAAAAGACKGPTPTLQGAFDGISESVSSLLGAKSLPGKYVQEIYAVHEDDKTWRFKADVTDALGQCCESIRGLGAADYASWRETAIVVNLLVVMSDEHPSALVRAESLDTLPRMFSWTSAAVSPTERRTTDDEMNQALDRIVAARKAPKDDPGVAADLADALNVVAAYRFDQARGLPEKIDVRRLARDARGQLKTTGRTLRQLTGGALGTGDADPRVRDALDRALVGTSASAIRLALVSAATGAANDTVRTAAVRDLEQARPDQAGRILGAVLQSDDSSSVRREAARALGSFPEAEAVPPLLAALSDDRFEVRATASASLAAVTGQTLGDDRRAWLRWWQSRSGGSPAPGDVQGPR